MSRPALSLAAATAIALCAGACELEIKRAAADAGTTDVAKTVAANYAGVGIGGACATSANCRQGLTCEGGKCAAKPVTAENGKCLLADECLAGLHCSWAGFCTAQPAGAAAAGAACEKTADCAKGMYCKALPVASCTAGATSCGACTVPDAANPAPEGEECTSAAQCPPGMVCDAIGLSGTCKVAKGSGDIGAKCASNFDCLRGLACSATRGECVPGSILLNPDLYPGVECPDAAEDKLPFGAVVTVPRAGVSQDFYSFPFPADVYKKNNTLDIAGHPRPGLGVIGFDAVARVVESMAADMGGWGQTTAAYLRFTRALDPRLIKVVPEVAKEQATVRVINLNTGADVPLGPTRPDPDDKTKALSAYAAPTPVFHAERNKYICRNWLYVHARWSEVLDPNTPYAVVVTDGVREACGNGMCDKALAGETNATCPNDCTAEDKHTVKPLATLPAPQRSKDMDALIAAAKPSDPGLDAAWSTWAPLRAWLGSNPGVKPVSAAVFTTGDGRKVTEQIGAMVAGAAKATFAGDGQPVVCGPNVKSPCADPGWAATALGKVSPDPRGCPNVDYNALPYHEIHAKLMLPAVQVGKRPYLTYSKPTDKVREGAIHLDKDGKPAIVDFEPVCVAMTIPKGAKPATGWPVVIFGHGTGGSFRSGADALGKTGATPALTGSKVAIATIGFDGPMHANRRGTDGLGKPVTTDPGALFYNFANPAAARGNFWQGVADKLALFRFAKTYQGEGIPAAVPAVTFDPAKVIFVGHSQGATTGPIAVPYMDGLKGAVFSGCGGSLAYGLLGKKKPVDASVGMQIALQDLGTDANHPVINLLQNYFEVSDPLLYADLIAAKPIKAPTHVLHTYGHGDSYTPATTSRIFAAAARLTNGVPASPPSWFDPIADLAISAANLPLSLNLGGKVTAVSVQAKNEAASSLAGKPYDGHFVSFNDKVLVAQLAKYLGSLVNGAPVVDK